MLAVRPSVYGCPRWVLLLALAAPSAAHADAAVLLGLSTGARLELPARAPRFVVGLGPDLLTDAGLHLSARADLTHDLDGDVVLLGGWAGPGLREDVGLALGLAAGPALTWTSDGDWGVGGRLRTSWGLWFARAVLELDITAALPTRGALEPQLSVALALRWVPWSPWRL